MKANRAALNACWFPLVSVPLPKSRSTTVLFGCRFWSEMACVYSSCFAPLSVAAILAAP